MIKKMLIISSIEQYNKSKTLIEKGKRTIRKQYWGLYSYIRNYIVSSPHAKNKVARNEVEQNTSRETVSKTDKFYYCNGTSCIFLIYGTRWSDIQPFVTMDIHNKQPIVQ